MDPKKLQYIVESATKDEALEQAERLQRGELSQQEAEAMRTSSEPDQAILYELYRPLDDLEKRRLLRAKTGITGTMRGATLALAAAAVLAVVFVQRPLEPEPAEVRTLALAAEIESGQHKLGDLTVREIDIGGCTGAVIGAKGGEGRLPPDQKALAFFKRDGEVIPWPVEFKYHEPTGYLVTTPNCAPIPSTVAREGEWQLVVVYGSALPSLKKAQDVVRGSSRPPWARYNVAPTTVKLRRAAP